MEAEILEQIEKKKKERTEMLAQKKQEKKKLDDAAKWSLQGNYKLREQEEKPPTTAEILDALDRHMGFIAHAAKYLGMSASLMSQRINKSPELKDRLHTILQIKLDYTESQLERKIKDGNLSAIIYFLKCKGGSRGWNNDTVRPDKKREEERPVFNINFAAKEQEINDDSSKVLH